jgi:hypothetical protein
MFRIRVYVLLKAGTLKLPSANSYKPGKLPLPWRKHPGIQPVQTSFC